MTHRYSNDPRIVDHQAMAKPGVTILHLDIGHLEEDKRIRAERCDTSNGRSYLVPRPHAIFDMLILVLINKLLLNMQVDAILVKSIELKQVEAVLVEIKLFLPLLGGGGTSVWVRPGYSSEDRRFTIAISVGVIDLLLRRAGTRAIGLFFEHLSLPPEHLSSGPQRIEVVDRDVLCSAMFGRRLPSDVSVMVNVANPALLLVGRPESTIRCDGAER